MSSNPESLPVPFFLEPMPAAAWESNASSLSKHVLALPQVVAQSATGMAAVEQTFGYLRDHCYCAALKLEMGDGESTRFFPFGDTNALNAMAAASAPPPASRLPFYGLTVPFPPVAEIDGRITYVFAPKTALPAELLEAITPQLAFRLANDRLRRRVDQSEASAVRRIHEMTALYDMGQALPPGGGEQLLQKIVDRTALLMEAQACSILLIDESRDRLRVAASHGLPPDIAGQTHLVSEGIAGRVAQTKQPLLIVEATRDDPRLEGVALRPDIGSAMLVPLKDQEQRVLGVLSIRRRADKAEFTQEDVKLFSVFAGQAALALVNARLVENLNRRAGELLKLSTLSRALLSTIDLDALLRTVVEDVCDVVGFDRCCLYLRDNNRPLFTPRLLSGYPESVGRNPVKMGEGAVGLAARTRTMLRFDSQEPASPEQSQTPAHRQMKGFARSLGAKAFVAIPILTSKDTCIGVLVADNQRKRAPIATEQTNLLQAFVSQAGIAIENAQLYERMQDSVSNLRRLTDYTDNVLQSIESAILTTDARGQVARWNRAAEEILQCPPRALREAPLADALAHFRLPDVEYSHLLGLVARVQETGERIHRVKLTLHPQHRPSLTVYLMITRLPDHKPEQGRGDKAERAGVVLIFEDVTQEVRLEAELEKMRRLADIGQLAAKMAHEVRNALSPIKGAAQIIRSEMIGLNLEWPDMIIAEVEGLSRLTSEMLDFARPMSLDPRPVVLNAFLQTALQSLMPFLTEHQVRLQWLLEPLVPIIMADVVLLGQVVRNLVMNAAQSMPDGGSLTVQSAWDEAGQTVCMRFTDTGTGIKPEDVERIFRPFVTTRPKGTGLGLPIVQKIVDQHGGWVEVLSTTGEGTTFTVFLPLVPPHDVRQEPPLIYDRGAGAYPDK